MIIAPQKTYYLAIDVATRDKDKLMERLAKLKSTVQVADGGEYWRNRYYSQIHVTTHLTEAKLGKWLQRVNHGAEYKGIIDRAETYREHDFEYFD